MLGPAALSHPLQTRTWACGLLLRQVQIYSFHCTRRFTGPFRRVLGNYHSGYRKTTHGISKKLFHYHELERCGCERNAVRINEGGQHRVRAAKKAKQRRRILESRTAAAAAAHMEEEVEEQEGEMEAAVGHWWRSQRFLPA